MVLSRKAKGLMPVCWTPSFRLKGKWTCVLSPRPFHWRQLLNKKGPGTCELRQAHFQVQRPRPAAVSINHGLLQHEFSEVCTHKLLRCPETADTSLSFEASRMGLAAVMQQSDLRLPWPPRCECKLCFFASLRLLARLWPFGVFELVGTTCKTFMQEPYGEEFAVNETADPASLTHDTDGEISCSCNTYKWALCTEPRLCWLLDELGCWESSFDRPDS